MTRITLKVLENNQTIISRALAALLPQVETYLQNHVSGLETKIAEIVIASILNQPEYISLIGGALQYQFGLPDPERRVSDILDTIRRGTNTRIIPSRISNGQISSGVVVEMIPSGFSDLLSLEASVLVTEKGTELNWLDWLLIQGDTAIVGEYRFALGPSQYSRTGMGLMIGGSGFSWRVPPEYAGNITNNWITRAIDQSQTAIESEIASFFR